MITPTIGDWYGDDSFVECQITLNGLCPVLKVRVVNTSTGNFEIIIRDATTGQMVAGGPICEDQEKAKDIVIENAVRYLEKAIKELKKLWFAPLHNRD